MDGVDANDCFHSDNLAIFKIININLLTANLLLLAGKRNIGIQKKKSEK